MIHNPIIHRELLGLLRTPKAIAIQVVFVAAMAALVVAVWPDSAVVNLGGRQAQQLLAVFVYGLLAALVLLAPAFPATAIVRERQTGTLMLLLTSPLKPFDVLIGKVVSSIGFILLLMVLSLPAAASCTAMGGVSVAKLASIYAVLFAVALEYTIIALLVSAKAKSTDGALRTTYGVILVMAILVLAPYYMLQGKQFTPEAVSGVMPDIAKGFVLAMPQWMFTLLKWAFDWLVALSPIPAINELLGHSSIGTRGMEAQLAFTFRHLVLAGLITVGGAILLLRELQPHRLDRPRSKGAVTDDLAKGARVRRRIMFLVDPNKRSGTIADYENPVMMKEFRTRAFGRAHWMIRIVGACLVVSLALMFVATIGTMWISVEYMSGVLVVFQIGLIVLLTPALASALICGEVESGGWTLLQMTPLSAWRIVFGKLLSVAWTLLLVLLATLPGYAVMLKIDENQVDRVIQALISLSVTSVFAMLVGAACSACFRRTSAATTTAYMLLVGLCVVTLLPWLGEGTLFGRELVEKVLWFNPLAAALHAVRMPGMEQYETLIPNNWIILGIGSLIAVVVLWIRTWQLTQPK